MDFAKRQQRIVDRLRPKPISHGQIETHLIAVSSLKLEDISDERRQLLKDSIEQEGSNLIPVIVRRTEAYEEEEYEVVFGADWCLVAKELDLDRIWVWAFDLTDDQAELTRQEMELLTGSVIDGKSVTDGENGQDERLVQQINVSLQKVLKVPETLRESIPALVREQMSSLMNEMKQSLILEVKQSLINEALDEFRQSLVQDIQQIIKPPLSDNLEELNNSQLKALAKERKIRGYSSKNKADLITLIRQFESKV